MLGSAPSGLEVPDKVERLPKKPNGKTNSKEKLNHEAAYPTALSLCQTASPEPTGFRAYGRVWAARMSMPPAAAERACDQ